MKKQVTFSQSESLQQLHQDEAFPKSSGINESTMDLDDVDSSLSANGQPAVRCDDVTSVEIPKTVTAAPFLKHASLTPAQRKYLYTIAASYSSLHVRELITQHYLNVLHTCTRAGKGFSHEETKFSVSSDTSKETDELPVRVKHVEKSSTAARHPGKSSHPKIPNRQSRPPKSSTQTKMKTIISPTLKRRSPRRAGISLAEDQEEEDPLRS